MEARYSPLRPSERRLHQFAIIPTARSMHFVRSSSTLPSGYLAGELRPPGLRPSVTQSSDRGAFCPREYRRTSIVLGLGWTAGFATVAMTLAIYFIDAEPAIRAYSPSFDLRFTAFIVGMLALGFSQVPLSVLIHEVPRVVAPARGGFHMTYVGLAGARDRFTPWEKVKAVELIGSQSPGVGQAPPRCSLTFVPGGARWHTNSITVESTLVEDWLPHLPATVRSSFEASHSRLRGALQGGPFG
jgi:hypothetical protein